MSRDEATHRTLTEAEQRVIARMPLHEAEEIKSYLKPGEGMERVAPTVFKYLERNPAVATVLGLSVEHLREQMATAAKLGELETVVHALYRRATENRMEAESDVYRALLKVNRHVRTNGDAELKRELAELSGWVSASHPGHAAAKPETTSK